MTKTSASIDWRNPERAADALTANWRKFDSFGWHSRPENANDLALIPLETRDSDTLTRCNAMAIRAMLDEVDPDKEFWDEMNASHWAVGWVVHIQIQPRHNGEVTPVWDKYCEIQYSLEQYPCLDDEKYSAAQLDELTEYIREEAAYIARRIVDGPDETTIEDRVTDDPESTDKIVSFLVDHCISNVDDATEAKIVWAIRRVYANN